MTYRENGIEETETEGYADKNTVSLMTTDAGDVLGDGQECYCAHAETPLELTPCSDQVPPQIPCSASNPCPYGMTCPIGGCVTSGFCVINRGNDPECVVAGNPVSTGDCTDNDGNEGHCYLGFCQLDECARNIDCNFPGVFYCRHEDLNPSLPKRCYTRAEIIAMAADL